LKIKIESIYEKELDNKINFIRFFKEHDTFLVGLSNKHFNIFKIDSNKFVLEKETTDEEEIKKLFSIENFKGFHIYEEIEGGYTQIIP